MRIEFTILYKPMVKKSIFNSLFKILNYKVIMIREELFYDEILGVLVPKYKGGA